MAWYTVATIKHDVPEKPDMTTLRQLPWTLRGTGTASTVHIKRMALELVAQVTIDRTAFEATFGVLKPGKSAAVNDISISNNLWVASQEPRSHRLTQAALLRKPELPLHAFAG